MLDECGDWLDPKRGDGLDPELPARAWPQGPPAGADEVLQAPVGGEVDDSIAAAVRAILSSHTTLGGGGSLGRGRRAELDGGNSLGRRRRWPGAGGGVVEGENEGRESCCSGENEDEGKREGRHVGPVTKWCIESHI